MGDMEQKKKEEAQAQLDIWKYIFGFTDMALVRCAIELGIPDILENQAAGRPMSLSDLASAVGCPPSTLYRVMRFLVNRRIFREEIIANNSKGYVKTPLSSLLTKNGEKSMASWVLFETDPFKLAPWLGLSKRVLTDCKYHAFEAANGENLWSYVEANPGAYKLFHDAMDSATRMVIPAIIEGCSELFHGLESMVDVGGGNGTATRMLVDAFPWIRGIVFDLPNVIGEGERSCVDNMEHIAGDMFHSIPKADSVFMKWILHCFGDAECIKILRNCKEAIPEDKGKVIIVESIINDELQEDNIEIKSYGLENFMLPLDMVILNVTEAGKERTLKEWELLLDQAGFSRHTVHYIPTVQSVIVAYP